MRKRAPVTMAILIGIAIVFAYEVATNAFASDEMMVQMGAIVPGLIQRGELWRLLASLFLHGSWIHWATNSWALYQLGSLYEALFGSKRFATIYFVSGICAGIASSLYNHGPAVGASGAIFGVLGAFIFSIRRSHYRHQPWTRSLLGQLMFWIVVNLLIGYFVPFIDNVAHMGGLITGLLLGLLLPYRVPPPNPRTAVVDVSPGQYDH